MLFAGGKATNAAPLATVDATDGVFRKEAKETQGIVGVAPVANRPGRSGVVIKQLSRFITQIRNMTRHQVGDLVPSFANQRLSLTTQVFKIELHKRGHVLVHNANLSRHFARPMPELFAQVAIT